MWSLCLLRNMYEMISSFLCGACVCLERCMKLSHLSCVELVCVQSVSCSARSYCYFISDIVDVLPGLCCVKLVYVVCAAGLCFLCV